MECKSQSKGETKSENDKAHPDQSVCAMICPMNYFFCLVDSDCAYDTYLTHFHSDSPLLRTLAVISDLLACLLMIFLHNSLCLLLTPISLLIIPVLLITFIVLTNSLPYCLTHPPTLLIVLWLTTYKD
jgi:hypothetical protein